MAPNLPIVQRINVNKNHISKILYLLVEINNHVMEGLVGMGVSMSILVAIVVRELRIMHLVIKLEFYDTISRVVTQAMGKIEGLLVWIRKTTCNMVFMVVDTNNYDVLLGLDFLIKMWKW